ncbi:MAG: riboflavin biosynthesis protein RibF [Lentisphaeria bacterium]|nr:riboflavin biosynthesis protein RibF [Lentisphaeria bacterium]
MAEFIPPELNHIKELALYGIDKAVVAVGVFDGVHRGHQKLLMELLTISSELIAYPVVMTFFPHPRSLLTDNPPNLLYPQEEKLRLLHSYGVKAVITVPFTREFAALSPEKFLNQSVFAGTVPVLGICVGRHWRFGAGAAGDTEFLERVAGDKKFRFSAVDELCTDSGELISSTAIRKAVSSGQLEKAQQMLGRRYSLSGIVVHGYCNAGEKLDAPTANLQIRDGVLPPCGVYAAIAHLSDCGQFAAAVNIGVSPTFQEQYGAISPRVEVHLLDGFQGDLYGQKMKLELAGMVRAERRFPDVGALKCQIIKDIKEIQKILERS